MGWISVFVVCKCLHFPVLALWRYGSLIDDNDIIFFSFFSFYFTYNFRQQLYYTKYK